MNYEREEELLHDLLFQFITTDKVDMTRFNAESLVGIVPNVEKKEAERVVSNNIQKEYLKYRQKKENTNDVNQRCTFLEQEIDRLFNIIWFLEMEPEDWKEYWDSSVADPYNKV